MFEVIGMQARMAEADGERSEKIDHRASSCTHYSKNKDRKPADGLRRSMM